jgi:2-polyprenyl-3-methyl-5-hydroxy-6-metoxy-1,4-benzoquinol methylase
MINIFKKLQSENLLKEEGKLLDLGCGNGNVSLLFFQAGYQVTLVDKDPEALKAAELAFSKVRSDGFKIENAPIESFDFNGTYDGIILSSVLPFLKDKDEVQRIIKTAWEHLAEKGFLFVTLFGDKDSWATDRRDSMSFFTKEEAASIIDHEPYYFTEDYGHGVTRIGDAKVWHILSSLYLK